MNRSSESKPAPATWQTLLEQAVDEPGRIAEAYSAFHGYSIGNQLLALWQCRMRSIQPGPINTYKGWQGLGRQVVKGAKAIDLWMPLTGRRTEKSESGEELTETFTYFRIASRWFVLAQTDGEPIEPPATPGWERSAAIEGLDISEVAFTMTDGNVQGFATGRSFAINPVNPNPLKTFFHEAAHILLGHTGAQPQQQDGEAETAALREAEAEAVALVCIESLGLDGADLCRGYIQNWYGQGNRLPETSARRIFRTAERILSAGRSK